MFISIIVSIYNVEEYLDRCITSLINQSYGDIEIILVDDGSTDKGPEKCDKYSKEDSRIKVIHKNNGGLSDARNVGLINSSGEFVLFVDADDYLCLDACKEFYEFTQKYGFADILIGGMTEESGKTITPISKATIGKKYKGEEYYVLFNKSIMPCAVIPLFRREFLVNEKLRFVVGRYHEDNEFTPRAYISASCIMYTPIKHYIRTIREDSITQKKDKRKNLEDMIAIGYLLIDYANNLRSLKTRHLLLDGVCSSYLSLFYTADVFQYKGKNDCYINRKLALKTAHSLKNRIKALLFCLSPFAYVKVRRLFGVMLRRG